VKVPLLDDDGLLARMHRTMRYNSRLAPRRGVTVVRAAGAGADRTDFYRLLRETAERNAFCPPPRAACDEVLEVFGDDAALLFALADGVLLAGELVVRCGDEALCLFAASSTRHRVQGATAYLKFEAMRWARHRGCRWYDLDGLQHETRPGPDPGRGRVPRSHSLDHRGLDWFKHGFGGHVVRYPAPLERRYRPAQAALLDAGRCLPQRIPRLLDVLPDTLVLPLLRQRRPGCGERVGMG
jgi:lipid II:glycine glycyltransferase (peptidoglycan interpeptide bridge formation enzyme)